ncbi:MAG: EF-P beta-lysylation protein EpmB [Pseudomonadota bacterium]
MLRTIPLTIAPVSALPWQEQLADLITDPLELLALLKLTPESAGYDPAALADFPLRVTRTYVARMQVGNARDPLLLQVLPHKAELQWQAGYTNDPLQEADANPVPGVLHKYHGRVLLIATQSCAIHCRYCFRRHFPYADNRPSRKEWQQSIEYIAADSTIEEVILSGGDPLAVSNTHLQFLLEQLGRIPHLQRIRFHTRLPILLPDRIDQTLLALFAGLKQQVVVVIHANHAQELDAAVLAACARLRAINVHLLNQSVLLADINDRADALIELSQRLFAAGVLPYYLHMLDKVSGAAHFDVASDKAQALIRAMQARLPGYLVPKLVRELPQEPNKTLL